MTKLPTEPTTEDRTAAVALSDVGRQTSHQRSAVPLGDRLDGACGRALGAARRQRRRETTLLKLLGAALHPRHPGLATVTVTHHLGAASSPEAGWTRY